MSRLACIVAGAALSSAGCASPIYHRRSGADLRDTREIVNVVFTRLRANWEKGAPGGKGVLRDESIDGIHQAVVEQFRALRGSGTSGAKLQNILAVSELVDEFETILRERHPRFPEIPPPTPDDIVRYATDNNLNASIEGTIHENGWKSADRDQWVIVATFKAIRLDQNREIFNLYFKVFGKDKRSAALNLGSYLAEAMFNEEFRLDPKRIEVIPESDLRRGKS